jgi:hypothetical protein
VISTSHGETILRRTLEHLDAQFGVTRHRVVRFDRPDDALHPFHHRREIELGACRGDAEFLRSCHVRQQPGRADQRLRGDAAGVQAVATHAVLLDQRHLGLDGSGNIGSDQAGAASADDDQVAVEASRLLPRGEDLVRAADVDDLACQQRKDPEQGKRTQEAG